MNDAPYAIGRFVLLNCLRTEEIRNGNRYIVIGLAYTGLDDNRLVVARLSRRCDRNVGITVYRVLGLRESTTADQNAGHERWLKTSSVDGEHLALIHAGRTYACHNGQRKGVAERQRHGRVECG